MYGESREEPVSADVVPVDMGRGHENGEGR